MFRFLRSFVCSKSIAVLALYLSFAALCSVAVGYGFHRSSLEKFRAQKSEEKITALRLVDAFVTTYNSHRGVLPSDAPVPATFRAKSIEQFNSAGGSADDFVLRWVGRPGREIRTPPSDLEMASIVENFGGDPKPQSLMTSVDGRRVFRTVYPSLARDQACVSCHNDLQPKGERWKLGDVMGAFAIDVPVEPFFAQIRRQAMEVGFGLFAALALVGMVVSLLQHRQLRASQAADSGLRELNQSLEAATKAKTDFLANMSHEIRTPMNGVFGMTDLLLKTRLSDHQYRLVSTINQSAKTLLTIVNDILDISRIEAGKMALDRQPFDIRHCVEGAVDLFLDTAGRKGLSLSLYVAPSVPQRIVGDAGRLRQVCINLVGNAVKFTPAGEVGVRLTVECDADGAEILHVEVTDTGIGMDAAKVEKLCKPFEQADSSIARRFGGTGLGLSISRHIVELFGGRLELRSAPGRGTTVQFSIPLERVGEADEPQPAGILAGSRILIVDERETSRSIICDYLAADGAELVQATSAREGLELLGVAADGGFPFDAVVVEAIMADVDGLEFLAAKAGDPRHDAVKAIVLTSMSWPGDVSEIRQRGAHALLAKPVSQRVISSTVAAALGRSEIATTSGGTAGSTAPVADVRRLNTRVLLAEDNPVNIEVAQAYLAEFGCSVRVAENGREAVEAHAEQGFDLVLMDAQMPDLDGLSATRMIREREATQGLARIPIIAVTANAFDEDRKRCLDAGMDDYLSKPYSEAQLLAVLEKWTVAQVVTRATTAPERASSPVPLAAIVAKLGAGDLQPTKSRRGKRIVREARSETVLADIKMLPIRQQSTLRARMVAGYLDHAPNAHVSLKAALERCDAVALKLAANSLKSSSASLGAHELAKLLAQIEKAANTSDLYACTTLMARLEPELAGVLSSLSDELLAAMRAVAM